MRTLADDTAMADPTVWCNGNTIRRIYSEYAACSGLELNLKKTCFIPLDARRDIETWGDEFIRRFPSWEGITFAGHGLYLGFQMGPDKGESSWRSPLAKYRARAEL